MHESIRCQSGTSPSPQPYASRPHCSEPYRSSDDFDSREVWDPERTPCRPSRKPSGSLQGDVAPDGTQLCR